MIFDDFGANYIGDVKFKKQAVILILALILGIVLCSAVSAAGLADSSWPKIGHDLNNTGLSQYSGPQTNATKWIYTTGAAVSSSPVIGSDGTIYFGSWDNNLYALNHDGTQKWNYTTDGFITTSPVIGSDGTIYFGSWDKNFYALNPNGTQKWNYTTKGQIISDPAVGSDGTIYFGDTDTNLYALNPDGSLKWNYTTGNLTFSSPAVGSDGTIYFGSDNGNLYALNPDGSLKWNYTTGSYVESYPSIGSDGTVYFGSCDNIFYALNSDGSLKWKFTTGDYVTRSAAIGSDGTLYFGSCDGIFYALNLDGSLKWSFTTGNEIVSSPVVGSDGTIYFGNNYEVYALNPNGTQKWNYSCTTGTWMSSLVIGSDGTLYFGRGDYNLYALSDKVAVASVDPANNTVNVPAGKSIEVTFSSPIKMGSGQIELKNSSGDSVPFTTSINGSTLTITPVNFLSGGAEYTLTMYDGSIVDLNGNSLERYSTSFTVDSIPPDVSANQTSGVSNSSINVNLSSESDAIIHYRINNGSWSTFKGSGTVPIDDEGTYSLEFYAVDTAGNPSAHTTYTYTIDKTAPAVNASKTGGISNSSIGIVLSTETNATIYYRINGGSWNTFKSKGTVYVTDEGIYNLEFYAVDTALNPSAHTTYTYTIDKTAPAVNASRTSGISNSSIGVVLSTEANATIYYRVNSASWKTFKGSGTVPISAVGSNKLEFYAVDNAGNPSTYTTYTYTIDKTAPAVTATPTSGLSKSISVTLSSESNAKIYYRINKGSWYTFTGKGKVSITNSGTNKLEFYAVDAAGNPSAHKTCSYTIDKAAPNVVVTSPKNKSAGISRTAVISIRLSENILKSSNWSKLYIKNLKTGAKCKITAWVSGNHLYVKTNSKRAAYTSYQVYIPASAVKDSAGNNLAAGYTFRFKTGK